MTTNDGRVLATPVAVFAGLLAALSLAVAQPVRITQPLDASKATVLVGNRTSKARPENDQGPLDIFQSIGGMTLELKSSASQVADLAEFLQQQAVPSSPNYHRWLTPEQYATRFGVSPGDLEEVTTWLQTEGFRVDYVARARTWVLFSGTAGRVGRTFHTEIHRYNVRGKLHYANSADPSIPSALAPVILLIRGLDDFRTEPNSVPIATFTATGGAISWSPKTWRRSTMLGRSICAPSRDRARKSWCQARRTFISPTLSISAPSMECLRTIPS